MLRAIITTSLLLFVHFSIAQNVGIGTTTPVDKLTVQTPVNSYGITHTDGAISLSTFVGGGFGGAWLGTKSPHALQLYTNNATTPNLSLLPNFYNDFRGVKPWTRWYDGSNESGSIRSDGSNLELAAYKPSTLFVAPGNLILQAGVSGQFFSDYAGYVGIGVRDPQFKLDISERIRLRSGSPSETAGIWYNNPTNSTAIGFIGVANANTIGLYGNSYGWGINLNTVTGNVGIGTLNPTYKLAVNGTTRTKEVVVETNWADYVFDKSYKLKTLAEVESFIDQHQHLPNIPSAKEIEQNGLHVGDVQRRMMEKIEELTLYIIAQQKEIERLKSLEDKINMLLSKK